MFCSKKNSAPPTQFPTGLVAPFKTGLESLGTLKRKSPKKWKKKRIYFFFYFTFVIIIFIIFFMGVCLCVTCVAYIIILYVGGYYAGGIGTRASRPA
jgi:hypothetical protein